MVKELIVGDPSTGKTTLAIDAIIAQANRAMICIYVAVWQKTSSLDSAIDALQQRGNFSRCIVLVAGAASTPGLQWIAPYAGMTMAEYFRDEGQHALIAIDGLTKHAATHRTIALLTRQSPGREAYRGMSFASTRGFQASLRPVRQEAITAEIIELGTGVAKSAATLCRAS